MSPRITVLAVSLASLTLIGSFLYAQETPRPRSEGRRAVPTTQPVRSMSWAKPAPPPIAPGKPRSAEQRTLVQVDVLQVQCTRDQLAQLNLAELAGTRVPQMLDVLKKIGTPQLMHRMQLPMLFDTASEGSIRSGARVPVTRDMTMSRDGKVTPSVSYEDTGLVVEVNGAWVEVNGGTRAEAYVEVEWSDVSGGTKEIAAGVKLPVFAQYKFRQPIQLASGESAVYLVNRSGDPGDAQGPTTLGIVRITMTQIVR